MYHTITRRGFLGHSAAAVAGVGLGRFVSPAHGVSVAIPRTRTARHFTPNHFFPDPPSVDTLQRLAVAAMDAARAEGAEFADIRVGTWRTIEVPPFPYTPAASLQIGYGVRAWMRGVWGFQYGTLLSTDAVTAAARSAVTGARRAVDTNARLGRSHAGSLVHELAPAAAATGEWRSPCLIDPFSVPLDDYYRVMDSINESMTDVHRNRAIGFGKLIWRGETRVFASTEGALVTQYVTEGGPPKNAGASLPDHPDDQVSVDSNDLGPTRAGFESALDPALIDTLRRGIDDAARLRELPLRPFRDIGRFSVVFDGAAFASLVGATIGVALDSDRVFGGEADAGGTTFLAPPTEVLGAQTPQFSSHLTARVDRALPSLIAMQWDDEGVVPEPYVVLDRGQVIDYHTTRATAPRLADWYRHRGIPVRAHGTVVAGTPASLPVVTTGHLQVDPSPQRTSVDDLAREMGHGFIVRGGGAWAESGLTLASLSAGMVLEVQRGVVVARTRIDLQCPTKALFNSKLVALGDVTTRRTVRASSYKGIPWQQIDQPVTAPAALCTDIDVLSRSYRS